MKSTPKIVGLTGGIGSGKTTVANFFKELEIPVYISDIEAKALMIRSKVIKRKLIQLFGDEAYSSEKLNKSFIANKIFNDKTLLEKMNSIVHPKVGSHFKKWLKKQDAPYVIKEAAIFFENNTYKNLGLPPGLIAMPDISAIDAVLNYEKHSYFFFVADAKKPGFHKFSKTLAQHNQYAREYHRYLSQQGIRR